MNQKNLIYKSAYSCHLQECLCVTLSVSAPDKGPRFHVTIFIDQGLIMLTTTNWECWIPSSLQIPNNDAKTASYKYPQFNSPILGNVKSYFTGYLPSNLSSLLATFIVQLLVPGNLLLKTHLECWKKRNSFSVWACMYC